MFGGINVKKAYELSASMKKPEIRSLRDITFEMLESNKNNLSEVVYRRCLFIISENDRLLRGCELIKQKDLKGFGALMYETHEGLSKLYEVSCEELDFLADNAHTFHGVTGTRMMGGGFWRMYH